MASERPSQSCVQPTCPQRIPHHEPARSAKCKARVPRNALRCCSSVRLGLLLILAIAVYAALGTVSLAGPSRSSVVSRGHRAGRSDTCRGSICANRSITRRISLAPLLLALVVNVARDRSASRGDRISGRDPDARGGGRAGDRGVRRDPKPGECNNRSLRRGAEQHSIDRSRSVLRSMGFTQDHGVSTNGFLATRISVSRGRIATAIALDDGVRTGFSHSARVVSRLERGSPGDPPGWQFDEVLATGERRTLCLIAAGDAGSRKMLGTVLLALGAPWPSPDVLSTAIEQPHTRSIGLVWIEPQPGVTLALPASRGISVCRNRGGVWQAEFLDRAEFIPGTTFGNYRLSGPGFRDQILYAKLHGIHAFRVVSQTDQPIRTGGPSGRLPQSVSGRRSQRLCSIRRARSAFATMACR